MYWDNPIIEYSWPNQIDPVVESMHGGRHCLFYDAKFDHTKLSYRQHLTDLANWANDLILHQGIDRLLQDPANHYDLANLVKLNLWIKDIRQQGIVKPMLLNYHDDRYTMATGESRLRALECIPEIRSVTAFVGTSVEHAHLFNDMQQIHTFDHFAEVCGAQPGQQFLFRLTDPCAPYGIDWYEYSSNKTAAVTPGDAYCLQVLANYLKQHPNLVFSQHWFDQPVDWDCYKNC